MISVTHILTTVTLSLVVASPVLFVNARSSPASVRVLTFLYHFPTLRPISTVPIHPLPPPAHTDAHKDREKSLEFDRNHGGGIQIDGKNYGGAPQLLVRQATPSERARPLCTIDKFAWADEDNRVKIYVMMDGLADIGDDQVAMDWEEQSLELRITDLGGKDHVLTIPFLVRYYMFSTSFPGLQWTPPMDTAYGHCVPSCPLDLPGPAANAQGRRVCNLARYRMPPTRFLVALRSYYFTFLPQ